MHFLRWVLATQFAITPPLVCNNSNWPPVPITHSQNASSRVPSTGSQLGTYIIGWNFFVHVVTEGRNFPGVHLMVIDACLALPPPSTCSAKRTVIIANPRAPEGVYNTVVPATSDPGKHSTSVPACVFTCATANPSLVGNILPVQAGLIFSPSGSPE